MNSAVRSLPLRSSFLTLAATGVIASALTGCSGPESASESVATVEERVVGPVFVNEIHYDNTGTDTGEFVEVAGPAGTDLSGYSIVLYNGGSTGAGPAVVYDTDALSGVIPNQDDGYGTIQLAYPANGIQNGPADALALVAPGGAVVQFLSYEGPVTASGGPANGMTAVDIGVTENGSEPVGQSLQLKGSGSAYESFVWSPVSAASPGLVNAGQDFIGSGDTPPELASSVPSDGAVDVELGANVSVTFNEAVSMSGNWFEIACATSGVHSAAASGGPNSYVLDPDANFASGESCSVTVFAAGVSDLDGAADPLAANETFSFTAKLVSLCGDPATPIHGVQGVSDVSPLAGSEVTIEGVVVGDFQASASLGGFFVQEEDAQADSDPLTSEGIFVFQAGSGPAVAPGDVVRVKGTVSEFFGLTELSSLSEVQVCATGATVAPTPLSLPVAAVTDLEASEGMLVTFPQKLYASETFTLARFGEVALSATGRLLQPTNIAEPGAAAQAVQADNDRARIQLDDGSSEQNPAVVPYLGTDTTLRIGDSIENVTGVLSYAFSAYELNPTMPLADLVFTRANPRAAAPAAPAGSLTVASFNVLNYFTTLDDGSPVCGPTGGLDCRGANSASEFGRQREKILSALGSMNADIVGLIELENNASAAIADLVSGLNTALGAGTYTYVDTGSIGTDAIKVGLLYKPAQVALVGTHAILNSSVNPAFIDTLNRPVLAQTFRQLSTGGVLTVAVNHLKSKGSACSGDPDTGDGQGNCNQTRKAAAAAEVSWLASDPTGSGDPDFLVIGDLNAYAKEDPIDAFVAGGFENLVASSVGPSAYSYVFEGQSGYLDHALATSALADDVLAVTEWHINADEPVALDYNQEFNQSYLYQPGPYRSSDHDPVLVSFDLSEPPPPPPVPTCNGLTATVYVGANGRIVGGPLAGTTYVGLLLGGSGANVIVGTEGTDIIHTGTGGDTVCSLGATDLVLGGLGRDTIYGGAGDDLLQGGLGQDQLFGGDGSDTLLAGLGTDFCDGGAGTDTQNGCETRKNIP